MVAILGFTRDQIFGAVRQMYSEVAASPSTPFHFPVGRQACLFVGYPEALIDGVPEDALESFAGVGCPFRAGVIKAGDRVLDVGAGSGTDTLIAARLVGSEGKVWALDMTPAMMSKLRRVIAVADVTNVEGIEGNAESIPLPDAGVDVVTSNGVLNLVPDKAKAVAEISGSCGRAAAFRSRTSSCRGRWVKSGGRTPSSGPNASSGQPSTRTISNFFGPPDSSA